MRLNFERKLWNLMIDIEFDKTAEKHKNLIKKSKNLRKFKICKIYVRNKQRKKLLNIKEKNFYWYSIKLFNLIHSDICEMSENYGRFWYFIIFTDNYICTIFIKCFQIKNEAFQTFKNFYMFIWTQFDVIIQRIRSDNEDKYVSKRFQDEMIKKEMKWKLIIVYNSHENDIAEHINQILVNKIICILTDSNFSQTFWSELIDTTTYLKNQFLTKHFKSKTSHEILHDVKSNLSHFKIISCSYWTLILKKKHDKLNFKFKKCWLLEYEIFMQFILYDVKNKHVIWSCDM